MSAITWKNTSPPSFAAANALRKTAADQLQASFTGGAEALTNFGEYRGEKATDKALALVGGISNLDNAAAKRQEIMAGLGGNEDTAAVIKALDERRAFLQGNQTFANQQLLADQQLAEGTFDAKHRLDQYNQQKQLTTAQIGEAEATAAEKQLAYNRSINEKYQEKIALAEKTKLDDAAIREQTTNRLKEESKKGKGIFADEGYQALRGGIQASWLDGITSDADDMARLDRTVAQYANEDNINTIVKLVPKYIDKDDGVVNWDALESALLSKVGEPKTSTNSSLSPQEELQNQLKALMETDRRNRGEVMNITGVAP